MGEVAEMMLDGTLCEGCGEFLGAPVGYPRKCRDCGRADGAGSFYSPAAKKPKYPKVACKVCGKMVKKGNGEKDHMRVVHNQGDKVNE
jgi:hypothetical protein